VGLSPFDNNSTMPGRIASNPCNCCRLSSSNPPPPKIAQLNRQQAELCPKKINFHNKNKISFLQCQCNPTVGRDEKRSGEVDDFGSPGLILDQC
jgi:hypothetical protein